MNPITANVLIKACHLHNILIKLKFLLTITGPLLFEGEKCKKYVIYFCVLAAKVYSTKGLQACNLHDTIKQLYVST